MDGEGARIMEKQQEMASKEAYKEHLLKQIAKNTGNIHDLRNDHRQDVQNERVNNAVYYDMSEDDVEDVDIKDDMEGQSSNGSEKRRNRATEDRRQEITRLQEIHEMEKQALSDSHQANLKSTVDQLRTQLMGEAEMRHAEKEEITRQQVISEINMKETEARNVINQVHQQAQQQAQEAHNYIGNIVNFAEVKHQNLIAKEKSIKVSAEKKAKESNEKQKKQKTNYTILYINKIHRRLINEGSRKLKQVHRHRNHYQMFHHFPQAKKHLEVKINQNMIIRNQNMSQKVK